MIQPESIAPAQWSLAILLVLCQFLRDVLEEVERFLDWNTRVKTTHSHPSPSINRSWEACRYRMGKCALHNLLSLYLETN